jgi:hypothetical protein
MMAHQIPPEKNAHVRAMIRSYAEAKELVQTRIDSLESALAGDRTTLEALDYAIKSLCDQEGGEA